LIYRVCWHARHCRKIVNTKAALARLCLPDPAARTDREVHVLRGRIIDKKSRDQVSRFRTHKPLLESLIDPQTVDRADEASTSPLGVDFESSLQSKKGGIQYALWCNSQEVGMTRLFMETKAGSL